MNQNSTQIIDSVGNISRESCLEDRPSVESSKHEWGFISNFHVQYREIEKIFKQHWHILRMDKTLNQSLPISPSFIYRKAPNFGDMVVKKVLDPPIRPVMFWDQAGFYACRRCQKIKHPIRGMTEFTSTSHVVLHMSSTFYNAHAILCMWVARKGP